MRKIATSVLLIVLALGCVLSIGLPQVRIDTSADSLVLSNDPALALYRDNIKRFKSGEVLLLTYRPHSELFSAQSLDNLSALVEKLRAVEGVASVNSILNVPLLYSPLISIGNIANAADNTLEKGADSILARKEFQNSPIYKDVLVNKDESATAVIISLEPDLRAIELVQAQQEAREDDRADIGQQYRDHKDRQAELAAHRIRHIRRIAEEIPAEIFVGGTEAITFDIIEYLKRDMFIFGLLITGLIILLLVIIFRDIRLIIWPLLSCILCAIFILGLLGWLDWRMSIVSTNVVFFLLIVTMASSIHLLIRYRELASGATSVESRRKAVIEATKYTFIPCLYSTLTTMVAFGSLVASDIKPIIDFGWMMVIGVVIGFVLTLCVVPAGLFLFGSQVSMKSHSVVPNWISLYAKYACSHYKTIIVIAVMLCTVGGYGFSRLTADNRFSEFFHERTEVYQSLSVIDKSFGGTVSMEIIIAPIDQMPVEEDNFFADTSTNISNDYWWHPGQLRQLASLVKELEAYPEIGKVDSLATLWHVLNDVLHAEPNNIELQVVRNLLHEDLQRQFITPYLDEEGYTRISFRIHEGADNLLYDDLINSIEQTVRQRFGDRVEVTGLAVLYNNMLQSLFGSQVKTIAVVFIGILGMFLLLFRSIGLALLAVSVNVAAAIIVLGIMALVGIALDFITVTIAAITIGIGVDNSIHYLNRYRQEYQKLGDRKQAIIQSHHNVGQAVVYTTMIIVCGFSILLYSNFIPAIHFSIIIAVAMFMAHLATLFLLPALILLYNKLLCRHN